MSIARRDAFVLEEPHEILCRDVARRAGRERAAAEAADRRVEDGGSRLERGEAVRVAGVARVVAVEAGGARQLDESAHRRGSRNADRVRKDDFGAAHEWRDELCDDARIDRALEGTAERARHGHRRGRLAGRVEDRLRARDRLRERRVAVSLVEHLRRRERHVDAIKPGGSEPLPALLVEDKTGKLDAYSPRDARHDLLGVGHLRHAIAAHEAHRLDPLQPRGAEPVDELGAHRGRERVRLVLESIARPDIAYRYSHAIERSGYGYERLEPHIVSGNASLSLFQRNDSRADRQPARRVRPTCLNDR